MNNNDVIQYLKSRLYENFFLQKKNTREKRLDHRKKGCDADNIDINNYYYIKLSFNCSKSWFARSQSDIVIKGFIIDREFFSLFLYLYK